MKNEDPNKQSPKMAYDWSEFMQFLLGTEGEREKIGAAWFLFFDIAQNADRAGIYADNYTKLAKRYGVVKMTVKTWRQYLRQHGVIESYSRGHSVAFRLLDPYLSFLKPVNKENTQDMQDLLALKRLLSKTTNGNAIENTA